MDAVWSELVDGWPDGAQLARIVVRVLVAALLGAVVGLQRERSGKSAGLRTHMLVALGAALLVVAAQEAGLSGEGVSRVIQGIVTGIGFLGAGAILKPSSFGQPKGLTSAAGLWLTAALGVAAGLGRWAAAVFGAILIWVILELLLRVERPAPALRRLKRADDA